MKQRNISKEQAEAIKENPLPKDMPGWHAQYLNLKEFSEQLGKDTDQVDDWNNEIGLKKELEPMLKGGNKYGLLIRQDNVMDESSIMLHPLDKNVMKNLSELPDEAMNPKLKQTMAKLSQKLPETGAKESLALGDRQVPEDYFEAANPQSASRQAGQKNVLDHGKPIDKDKWVRFAMRALGAKAPNLDELKKFDQSAKPGIVKTDSKASHNLARQAFLARRRGLER